MREETNYLPASISEPCNVLTMESFSKEEHVWNQALLIWPGEHAHFLSVWKYKVSLQIAL